MKFLGPLAAIATMVAGIACVQDSEIGDTTAEMTFEEFEQTVYQEPDGVYIVNGDTPLETREQLREFYHQVFDSGTLIVNTVGGADDCWSPSKRVALTYCVSQSSFGSNYDRVVAAMEAATGAWEATADIDFVHDASQDGNCNQRNKNVLFDVRQTSSGQYLARAFFPNYNRRSSSILIDTSTYVYDDDASDPLSLTGVLRHELGHVLGFRHEHTRPESGTCYEDSNWRELTSYDSDSVMHYPQCNGTGDWSLTLTSRDAQGAGDLYGLNGSEAACDAGGDGGDGGDGGGGECLPAEASCSSGSQCCSGTCKGSRNGKTCR